MLATLLSATLVALDGRVIRVEVDVAPGLPGFTIVGLPDAAIREARERVRGGIRNSGYVHPPRRITVNLAPADLPKAGAAADLAIALGILIGSEQFVPGAGRAALIGEVSLGGEIRPVPGILPMVAALARRGVARVVVAADGLEEARLVDGIEVQPAATIADAVDVLRSRRRAAPAKPPRVELAAGDVGSTGPAPSASSTPPDPPSDVPDLCEVRGQLVARRALEIALAGGHGLLLVGPPGTGKTLLARTIPGLLPPLSVRRAPFRAPHHTSSYAALVGGGPALVPGEVTRADHGVLFLDELAEFSRDVLEALRQPLEDGRVTIVRARGAVTLPARFQLVAAMNPCPCGNAGVDGLTCSCPPLLRDRYIGRISGPLRDRIDISLHVPRLKPAMLFADVEPEGSAAVARRIADARAAQAARQGGVNNARITGRTLRRVSGLSAADQVRLARLADAERLSGRGTERLLRVARTIADLAGAEAVALDHLQEAARYRLPTDGPMQALAV